MATSEQGNLHPNNADGYVRIFTYLSVARRKQAKL